VNSIDKIQKEIIDEFTLLDGDQEMTVLYIMELGQKLPPLPDKYRTEEYIVKGCQSKVWLKAGLEDGKVKFLSDSNTAITKGLVSLLIRIYSGQSPEDILNTGLTFMKEIGMERFIGTQRSNGFAAMIKQMKYYALALKAQMELKS
jgi:cysteine desulfuration protein SufE